MTQAESSFNISALQSAQVENSKEVFVTPFWYGRLGINAAFLCFSRRVNIEAGYELTTYVSALSKALFMPSQGRSINEYNTFTLHGPYVALGIDF